MENLEPKTRLEYFLNKIAESGGSGGSGGVEPVIVTVNLTNQYGGTWTGATWEELMNAFNHNVAGIAMNNDGAGQFFWLNSKLSQDDATGLCFFTNGNKIILLQDGTVEV